MTLAALGHVSMSGLTYVIVVVSVCLWGFMWGAVLATADELRKDRQ